jgi:hypothetical protein
MFRLASIPSLCRDDCDNANRRKEKNTFTPMHTPKTTLAGYITNEIKVQCVKGA